MKIIKRNGTTVDFDARKIYNAMVKAANSVYLVTDDLADNLGRIARSIETQLQENGTGFSRREIADKWVYPYR